MAGASADVSYAWNLGEPEIYDYCGNMWIWPGDQRIAWVEADPGFTNVYLQVRDGAVWEYAVHCLCPDSDGAYWYTRLTTTADDMDETWYYRFVMEHSNGDTVYSATFKVECTTRREQDRIFGPTRYDTAIEASKMFIDGDSCWMNKNVIIASGTDFADALGGTYLAAPNNYPIFLVNNTSAVMDKVAERINMYWDPSTYVYILGGTGAVSGYMETALAKYCVGMPADHVKRIAGKNRYDTNIKVLQLCGVTDEELMVCCGTNFADALSASALGKPVVLVGKNLTAEQKDYLLTLSPSRVTLVGGTGAVPQSVEDWFNENHFEVRRIAGKNRYETSYELAYEYFYHQSYYMLLAYARNFPDGLAAGPVAYQLNAPLLLVDNNNYIDAEGFVLENGCRSFLTMGGPALISDDTVERIMRASDITEGGR